MLILTDIDTERIVSSKLKNMKEYLETIVEIQLENDKPFNEREMQRVMEHLALTLDKQQTRGLNTNTIDYIQIMSLLDKYYKARLEMPK